MIMNTLNKEEHLCDFVFDKHLIISYLKNTQQNLGALILELADLDRLLSNSVVSIPSLVKDEIRNNLNIVFASKFKFFQLFDDTFIIFFENVSIDDVVEFSHTLRLIFISSYDPLAFDLSLSIGITYGSPNSILAKVFTALKYAKKTLSRFYFFDVNDCRFNQIIQNDLAIRKMVKRSILNNQITSFYQPIYDNTQNKITKFECLARMIDENRMIFPNDFFDVAREMGCTRYITFAVINSSFNVFKNNDYDFSINIAEEDLRDRQVIKYLHNSCESFDISPSRIIIELLEDIEFGDDDFIVNNILYLKELGFKIAIDDFGYANSNFGRLIKMSVDYIKIDGRFIKNLSSDPISCKIVRSITSFAKSLKIECIAEHVHSEDVQDSIKSLGIEYSQGYYIGKASENLFC